MKSKTYKRSLDEYRKNIEKMVNDLMPRIDKPLAIAGFLLVASGLTLIFITISNVVVIGSTMTFSQMVFCFLYFIVSFIGYMLIHKSMERDWL